MATLGRSGDVALAERFARALAAELQGGRHHARLRAGARRPHQPEEPGHRRSRAGREGRGRGARSAARSSARCRREGVAACGKHFPGHGDTSTDSHLELPLVEHPPERLREVEFVPFRAAIEAGVATIMTAHVLVPALDEQRPATLSRRIVTGSAARRAGLRGRHPERRPRDEGDRRRLRRAGGGGAGDRGRLRRRADLQRRSRRRRPRRSKRWSTRSRRSGCRSTRVEDALRRQRRAKERFLASPVAATPAARARRCASVLGRDEHRADRRRDGALRCDAQAARARSRRPPRHRRPGQPVQPRGVRPAASTEIRRLGFEPVYDESVFARQRYVAGRRASCARRRFARRGAIRRSPASSASAAATAARSCCRCSIASEARRAAQAVHRLQRSHLDADVPDHRLRARRVSRADAGRPPRPRRATATTATSFLSALCRARADGRAGAGRARDDSRAAKRAASLLGGTLTQLLASLGTPFAFAPPPGYVLFLDEVGERPYRLDRMVTQLRQTGLLARAAAVVIGELPQCDEPSGDPTGARGHGRSVRAIFRARC